ncbi:MAG: cyclic nucleotide-binding domain-containing protein [Bacteroidota bacterium]|nr:cyclic nucleotide-binding domain-containing protein [Bacteroidota bacterium]
MLLIEKVLILKSSEIFQNTAETELVELAGILEEVYLEPNIVLFSKGDPGNCMYFIFNGTIKIHDGEHTLAVLGENEIVGELSVLDAESRSASATTLEECLLLKLEQEAFYEILMSNADILKGILRTLCKRLRVINKKSVTMANSNPLN